MPEGRPLSDHVTSREGCNQNHQGERRGAPAHWKDRRSYGTRSQRIKTPEPGNDKRAQATARLDKLAQAPRLWVFLENEAKELKAIGNNLKIRYVKTPQVKLKVD